MGSDLPQNGSVLGQRAPGCGRLVHPGLVFTCVSWTCAKNTIWLLEVTVAFVY